MSFFGSATHLVCYQCAAEYQADALRYTCDRCGDRGLLELHYDYERAARAFQPSALRAHPAVGLERYLPLLPVGEAAYLPPLTVGATPFLPGGRLAARLGLPHLFLKDDGRNPTGSLKDRASAVALAVARQNEVRLITGASTGNAASSLAGLAASVGLPTVLFVPAQAPPAKMAQLLIYGAQVLAVQGSYDQAYDLCLEATRLFGWFNRNTGFNPVLLEGKKTVAYEIWEDLGHSAPDAVLVSVGDGCILGGLGKGFWELRQMGCIDRLPRLYGVQAEGSSVLAARWAHPDQEVPSRPDAHTVADSICVGQPRAAAPALKAVGDSGGSFVVVSDAEILAAQQLLAQQTGIFSEPAAATAVAGLLRLQEKGSLPPQARVVVLLTGLGLKDVQAAMQGVSRRPIPVSPDRERLAETLSGHPSLDLG